jgi:putative Mn2+ efflux pump MntP
MGGILVISLALALGTYGVAAQRGANLVKLDRYTLIMSALWGVLALAAAFAGYGMGRWVLAREISTDHSVFWTHVLAGVLLVMVGVMMLLQAFKKKTFLEHRMESVDIRADVLLSLRLCAQALFVGVSCGLLTVPMPVFLLSVFVFSAVFAGIGYVSGRANGALFTDQAIGIGGGLLCVLGIALQIV